MQPGSDKISNLDSSLVEKNEQIVKLQSQVTQCELEIEVVKKTADEDKKRQESIHQFQIREQQRKHEEEINDMKLQLQRASTAASKTKAEHDSEIQTLMGKYTEERDSHTQDVTKLLLLSKEVEQLREEKRTLTANLAVVQNLADKVCPIEFFVINYYFRRIEFRS